MAKTKHENVNFSITLKDNEVGASWREMLMVFISMLKTNGLYNEELEELHTNLALTGAIYPEKEWGDDDDEEEFDGEEDFDDCQPEECQCCPDTTCIQSPVYVAKEIKMEGDKE